MGYLLFVVFNNVCVLFDRILTVYVSSQNKSLHYVKRIFAPL